MKKNAEQNSESRNGSPMQARFVWFLVGLCALVGLLTWLQTLRHDSSSGELGSKTPAGNAKLVTVSKAEGKRRLSGPSHPGAPQTAETIVAEKVQQFGRSRRAIVGMIALRSQKDIPPEVEKFFEAIESGRWEDIKAQWDAMAKRSAQYEGSTHSPELDPFWSAVLDAYGVAEQAHEWPAQKLLDYGNAILGSLRPGMVYVGGTDPGRWIPELLNETADGEQHMVVTQNAMADARYLEYMNTLYGGQFSTLTSEDSQRAFQEYTADAQKRFEHDRQFPNEPKQVRPGEDIRVEDGKVQVSGQVAVMSINEKLLQTLMQKNPDHSFAIQESIPLPGTYADAMPLGPLMELGSKDGQSAFTSERAAQSLEYWRNTAREILADPEATGSPETLKSYSHDTVAAANLLAAHNFWSEAEGSYRIGMQLCPENPEAVVGLASVLASQGRESEGRQLLDDFGRQHPGQLQDLERAKARGAFVFSATPKSQ